MFRIAHTEMILDSTTEFRNNRKLSHDVPDISDVVAVNVARHCIIDIGVEQRAVMGLLLLTVGAGRQRHLVVCLRGVESDQRRPVVRTIIIAT